MADFRRCILALAVVALLTGVASTASAQPFTCNATSAVPTLMRSEGLTELAGDIVLQCNGILPTGSLNQANISVFLGNTTVTSRILDTTNNVSEVLLLIDEPGTGNVGAPAFCIAGQTGCAQNVFQGFISGNQVTFIGIPVVPTASIGSLVTSRVFRITNLRANASAVGTGASGTPGQVTAFVSIAGPTSISVNNAQQTVGFVQKGLTFSVRTAGKKGTDQDTVGTRGLGDLTFPQCQGRSGTTRAAAQAALRFAENFATAFKVRQSVNSAGAAVPQIVPGAIYNTESGLSVPGLSGTTGLTVPFAALGWADAGTKLRAVFNNIPNGVNVFVSNRNIINDAPSSTSAGIQAVLVSSETAPSVFPSGVGGVVPDNSFTGDAVPANQVAITSGTGVAVWEVIQASSLKQEYADFYIYYGYSSNQAANSPATGTGTVAGTFAPVSTVATASATAPIPRFADTSSAINVIAIVACRTNLLFPFVTNQQGFDTGLAIANTSKDIFGTNVQAGTCVLTFFGDKGPAPFTTPSIAGGAVWVDLAQNISNGFQGYIIAQCGFQFGHGFAFVSDIGARNLAMGYLALVIPDQTDNSRGRKAITLDAGNGELLGQ